MTKTTQAQCPNSGLASQEHGKRLDCEKRRCLHVVVVDEELPFPANSGKRIRTLNLLLNLAKRYKITYLCHRSTDPAEIVPAQEFLHANGIETIVVQRSVPPKSGPWFYARLFANFFSPLPYSVQTHTSREIQAEVGRLAAGGTVDLWQCEWTPYAQNVLGLVEKPCVVMAHNVESLIWQRLWQNERNWGRRWFIRHQWKKYQAFEARVFSQATRTVTVSDADAKLAESQFRTNRIAVVENGVDVDYFCRVSQQRDRHEILFLGSLDWRANLDGIKMLLDKVFPQVQEHEPQARLSIVGRRPAKWLVARADQELGVELYADVPDVRPYLLRCGVMAVPLQVGGGSRLKILEALASGCPVVSTDVGSEGLRLVPGRHFAQASSPAEMAKALIESIRHPEDMATMAERGREVVLRHYDWHLLASRLDEVWSETAAVRPSPDV